MNGAKLKLESMIKLPLKKVSVLINCTHVTFIKKIDVLNETLSFHSYHRLVCGMVEIVIFSAKENLKSLRVLSPSVD